MKIKPSRNFEGSEFMLQAAMDLSLEEIIEDLVGPITWVSQTEGFCKCPGAYLHSTRDSPRDCKVYAQPVPTVSCFHGSCQVVVKETTTLLRRLALTGRPGAATKKKLTKEEKERIAQVQAKEDLRRQSASSRQRVLRDFAWTYEQIQKDSPQLVPVDLSTHWRDHLGVFNPDDVVWIGSTFDSGKPEHAPHFKKQIDWLNHPTTPEQFTCGSVFKEGSYGRNNANIVRRAFLVVESDELDRDTIGAVFRWMREKVKIHLRCIVDTAGKSLHGWFNYPTDDVADELKIILPEFGCDPKMFTASQPCRLAGALRDGRHQKLIYLSKGGAS